ncbi:Endonuclease/exonuclease/phosphatase [Irpex rosettiformis]|uniref:Endonuclease/exonuclease/phosphatase n=1 Tax=Irpex rosettiformis TaxID=378272 RepID=A0ACB8U203_9APHY|nr:Endonuclease/exonuclease/phosphatase [Irpex rosettiformis]
MRISTYNLRYDSMPDNITVQQTLANLSDPLVAPTYLGLLGEQPWSMRRIKVAQHLIHSGDVMASFQEALVRQVNDLAELLGDDWAWIGVGRDDGKQAGEFSPVFYKKSVVNLNSWDTFWLSNTPFDVSRFPGAGSLRICTAAHFTLVTNPSISFSYLNTHLDDQSDAQRRLGASLILQRAKFEAFTHNHPVVVTGDFNSPSTGTDSGAYQISTGEIPPVAINQTFAQKYNVPKGKLDGFVLSDLKAEVPRFAVSGEYATYTGFANPGDTSAFTRIDFVFGGSNGKWTADAYRVGTSLTDDGVYASDHRPVFIDITLEY